MYCERDGGSFSDLTLQAGFMSYINGKVAGSQENLKFNFIAAKYKSSLYDCVLQMEWLEGSIQRQHVHSESLSNCIFFATLFTLVGFAFEAATFAALETPPEPCVVALTSSECMFVIADQ
jgi:hypothetical protein